VLLKSLSGFLFPSLVGESGHLIVKVRTFGGSWSPSYQGQVEISR